MARSKHRRSPSIDELVGQHTGALVAILERATEHAHPGEAVAPRVHVPPPFSRYEPLRPKRRRSWRRNVNAAARAVAEAPSPGVPHIVAADRRGVGAPMATSSARDDSEATGQRYMAGWLVRTLVACPRCRATVGKNCWSARKGRPTRKSNHVERRRAAELLRT